MNTARIATNQHRSSESTMDPVQQEVHRRVCAWLEHAVIGLGLCPFAAGVHHTGALGMRIASMPDDLSLLIVLERELHVLTDTDNGRFESILLVMPNALTEFHAFNDFLDRVDETLSMTGLEGRVQVASFHPDYLFAGESPDDPSNCTNRAPYPILHLLLESSVSKAVASVDDPASIPSRNQAVLRQLGHSGWQQLSRYWEPVPTIGETGE